MTTPLKIATITLTSIVLLGGLGYFGLHQFIRSIYSQRSCEWANIDNFEMHAGVDIPEITECDCEYVKSGATKMAWFCWVQATGDRPQGSGILDHVSFF